MKKIVEFISNFPDVRKEIYRNDNRKNKKHNYMENYVSFNLLHHFFARLYTSKLLLRVYVKDQQKYKDIVIETEKMKWGIQKGKNGDWNCCEIPVTKINEENENIIIELIKNSYEIISLDLAEYGVYCHKIHDLEFNEDKLFDLVINCENAQEYIPLLNELNKKSVLLIENKEKRAMKGVSKLGGHPDLPLDFDWPYCEEKPLTFLGQINLSDINNEDLILPQKGIIYFFAAITNEEEEYYHFFDLINNPNAIKVFYVDIPNQLLKKKINNYFNFNQVVLDTKVVNAYPDDELDPSFKNYNLSKEQVIIINDVADHYYEGIDIILKNKSHHNLLGYARCVQGMCSQVQNTKYINLFQMNSSENTNLDWGDDGMLYIFIDENDLKNLDFSKIIVDAQSG